MHHILQNPAFKLSSLLMFFLSRHLLITTLNNIWWFGQKLLRDASVFLYISKRVCVYFSLSICSVCDELIIALINWICWLADGWDGRFSFEISVINYDPGVEGSWQRPHQYSFSPFTAKWLSVGPLQRHGPFSPLAFNISSDLRFVFQLICVCDGNPDGFFVLLGNPFCDYCGANAPPLHQTPASHAVDEKCSKKLKY